MKCKVVFAKNSSPIDPIILKNEQKKISHSISITYIPDFTEITLIAEDGSHNYSKRTNMIKYSLFNKYRISENLSIMNNLSYYTIHKREYLNNTSVANLKENSFDANIGMRYEWFFDYVSPSIEINFGYPDEISIYASGSLIKDPIIHTIGLNYNRNFSKKPKQLSVIQSLGFLANDKVSLRLSIASLFSGNHKPQINSLSFSISYPLDPANNKNITFNNVFRLKDGNLHLNLGMVYGF